MEEESHGLILEEKPKETDRIFGASPTKKEVLRLDGQYDEYLPKPEYQRKRCDVLACVSFSAENCDETIRKVKYGSMENNSDRFTAKMSGTDPSRGNSMSAVADSKRKNGSVAEAMWSYPDNINIYQYYSSIPQHIQNEGKKYLLQYEVEYDWVYIWFDLSLSQKRRRLIEALPYGPIQVSIVSGTRQNENGYYQKSNSRTNHAVMLYGYVEGEYWKIYDHYDNICKKLEWDYNFGHAMQYTITKKPPLYETQTDGSVDGVAMPSGSIVNSKQAWKFIVWNKYIGLLFKRLGKKLGSLIKK